MNRCQTSWHWQRLHATQVLISPRLMIRTCRGLSMKEQNSSLLVFAGCRDANTTGPRGSATEKSSLQDEVLCLTPKPKRRLLDFDIDSIATPAKELHAF